MGYTKTQIKAVEAALLALATGDKPQLAAIQYILERQAPQTWPSRPPEPQPAADQPGLGVVLLPEIQTPKNACSPVRNPDD